MVAPSRKSPARPTTLKRGQAAQRAPVKRARRNATAEVAPSHRAGSLVAADREVLKAFRRFLMVPGEMLCFASHDLAAMRDGLRRLTDAGMLVAEKFPGAYSLTSAGFALMGADE